MTKVFSYFVAKNEVSWIPSVLSSLSAKHGIRLEIGEDSCDFAWVHRVNEANRSALEQATIRGGNGVSGTLVLEDKFSLGLLMKAHSIATLQSEFFTSASQLVQWCEMKYNRNDASEEAMNKLWMLKDAGANGGDGLYVMNGKNWKQVTHAVQEQEQKGARTIRFVLQEYITRPELWESKFKYHIRMYLILKGNMELYLHSNALIHVANKPFVTDDESLPDVQVHLTNVSKNHHNTDLFHGCPIVHLPEWLGESKLQLVKDLFNAVFSHAHPFLLHQLAATDFSHIGADVMICSSGLPHLLELNIPPCIGNYKSEMVPEQHQFFNDLFTSMLADFVLSPLGYDVSTNDCEERRAKWLQLADQRTQFQPCQPNARGFNNLAWKVFQRRHLS